MPSYTLTVPGWRPPSLNQFIGKKGWGIGRAKQAMADLLAGYAMREGVPRAAGRRRVSLLVTLGKGMRRYDRDNTDKLFLDSCTRAGLILDDSDRGLEGRVEVEYRRAEGREPWGTTITLTDCPPEDVP